MTGEERKKIKKQAKGVLRRHYLLLLVLAAIGILIGSRSSIFYEYVTEDLTDQKEQRVEIYTELFSGNLSGAAKLSASYYGTEQEKEASLGGIEAGHENGVIAKVVNKHASGSFLVSAAGLYFQLFDSVTAAGLTFMLLALLVVALKAVFVTNTFRLIETRVLLEGRIYKEVNMSAFTYFLRTKKWFRVSFSYLKYYLLLFLWNFTIIGALIKRYSYAMTKFILAENPSLTGEEAITLSRKMMKGHKWELFVFDLSFLPWYILNILTVGLLGILFLTPYRMAAMAEYYAERRRQAILDKVEGIEKLTDRYLYEKAEEDTVKEAYQDVLRIMEEPPVELVQPSGLRAFFQNVFGIVLRYDRREWEYRKYMADKLHVMTYEKIVCGEAYPARLCPLPSSEHRKHLEHAYYMRHYSLTSVILIFFSFCLVGWLWEVSIHIVTDGCFVNRGVMHGPWLPIYGSGAVLILLALYRFRRKPALEFLTSVVLCGAVEYSTSWLLEKLHDGQKWWDYSGYFLNVNGRICMEGLLVFGIAGMAAVYFIAPMLDNNFSRIKENVLWILSAVLVLLFAADAVYSHRFPNTGKGITDYGTEETAEETEEAQALPEGLSVTENAAVRS